MEIIKGSITGLKLSEGTGKKGVWKRFAYEINSKTYATFDETIGSQFKVGDFVACEFALEGNFRNILHMKVCDPSDTSVASTPTKEKQNVEGTHQGMFFKEASIVSQALTKCVYYGKSEQTAPEVYKTYKEFIRQLMNNGK